MRARSEKPSNSNPSPAERAESPPNFWIAEDLQAGRDCWRLAKADRAAVLIDAESYFFALRAAMLKAERCIHIVGWDLDRRMPFPGCAEDVARLPQLGAAGDEAAEDGYPLRLGDFLGELVRRKPNLWIRILLWDFSLLYAASRDSIAAMAVALRWKTPRRLDLCLDDSIPIGAAHHQKLIVIDDALAFCGGMDLTLARWDDCAHTAGDERRCMLDGSPYAPVHDIQVMMEGPVAQSISEYVRSRWARTAYENIAAVENRPAQLWPDAVAADFGTVDVALARTEPAFADAPAITEIERLFVRMIREAEHTIYIENQYLTSELIAATLIETLKAKPALEAVIICSLTYPSWVEDAAMIAGRRSFMQRQHENGVGDRVRLLSPRNEAVDEAEQIKVHAKLMIIDDRYLRIGSANLCRRSMGTDTEFDVTIVGEDDATRAAIFGIRDRLLAEHCGTEAAEIAAAIAATDSLRAAIDKVNVGTSRRLEPINDDGSGEALSETLGALADPERPIDPLSLASLSAFTSDPKKKQFRKGPLFWLVVIALVLTGLAAVWTLTPLNGIADVKQWESLLTGIRGPWEVLAVIAVFVITGFFAFPLVVLIAGTTAVFGVWPGMLYAGLGAMASALATYSLGWWLGQRRLRHYFGPGVNRIKQSLKGRGIITVTTIRLIPAAPYSLVNLAAGALHIPPIDYFVGTLLGLAPGILVMSLLGGTIVDIIAHPTLGGIAMLVGLLIATILLSLGLQMITSRLRRLFG
ncbi:VTT domain-containing protein [Dongia sedimenti]|uniref:Phospholipase D n=1 Tax=Dongia sedimenti TaxID=3064282 RepID=A0ABU0YF80_9PROT|nr:VTT domain-containing protein [Rhodospirillaceae bacterium R-7]